jgi:deoxyhypusine synthase
LATLNIHKGSLGKPFSVWQTDAMNQPMTQQQRPQYREDQKVQKLVQRIESKLALQAKSIREASQESAKN